MQILFATTNPYKLQEVRAILTPLGVGVLGLDSLEQQPAEPVEDSTTFEGNARLKATEYARVLGQRCLAEDSGLEVDALGGAPGVLSARYAGALGTREERDRANNQRLLAELAGVPLVERRARFVCAMCLAGPRGDVIAETRGVYEGLIAEAPRGTNGFGYDPLLYVPDLGRTSAELTSAEKNVRSHRAAAARALGEVLRHHTG